MVETISNRADDHRWLRRPRRLAFAIRISINALISSPLPLSVGVLDQCGIVGANPFRGELPLIGRPAIMRMSSPRRPVAAAAIEARAAKFAPDSTRQSLVSMISAHCRGCS